LHNGDSQTGISAVRCKWPQYREGSPIGGPDLIEPIKGRIYDMLKTDTVQSNSSSTGSFTWRDKRYKQFYQIVDQLVNHFYFQPITFRETYSALTVVVVGIFPVGAATAKDPPTKPDTSSGFPTTNAPAAALLSLVRTPIKFMVP